MTAINSLIDFRCSKDMLKYALEIFKIFSLTETIEEKNLYCNELQTRETRCIQDAIKNQGRKQGIFKV